ncbi:PREDICTED: uncharacterized protein LOC109585407 [Amphimedon queenslandica]|uniref:Caspase family p20 domain-containing protein n=1 Tax=Amphimedon queenslandica TaxID=400682 RepID=A0AAN0JJ95_AMPQE|nr:PREDICTED: uncharacterized protein LOC109585407 [Amphimedon queenslandica]|eukprot:XP_019857049.1 PREDICTED: uncharacterized protein LOC109585407 [Amphimedon queenslandica]
MASLKGIMKTFQKIFNEEKIPAVNIHLLVIGRTGHGKSTLINSIIEQCKAISPEGARRNSCTTKSRSFTYHDVIPGINVTLIDSPGLQHANGDEQKYLQELKSECKEVSLVLYCTNMKEFRDTKDDKVAIRKLHQVFGSNFWKRVVFVLTFANEENCGRRDDRDTAVDPPKLPPPGDKEWENLKRKRFINRVSLFKEEINDFMKECLDIHEHFEAVPAGCYQKNEDSKDHDPMKLPDREDWLYDVLKLSIEQIKIKHKFSMLRLDNKINFAIIIDNRGSIEVEDNSIKILSQEARSLKEALEGLGFFVLYFNKLTAQSIICLLQSFQKNFDHSQLSTFALAFLSSKETSSMLFNVNNEGFSYEKIFSFFPAEAFTNDLQSLAEVPKIIIFDLAYNQDKKFFLPQCPFNSIVLAATSTISTFSPTIKSFVNNISYEKVEKCFENMKKELGSSCNVVKQSLQDNLFIKQAASEMNEKQVHDLLCSMWRPIRCSTINELMKIKDEVVSVVLKERATKITTTTSGLAIGGSMMMVGLILTPFTFGASLGLTAAGAGVSIATTISGTAASAISTAMENKKLKLAQEHIMFDTQLSLAINEFKMKVKKNSDKKVALAVAVGTHLFSNFGHIGVRVVTAGVEAGINAGSTALRAGGAVAGGASLAVTLPIDIGFIAHYGYQLWQLKKDKSGKSDKNEVIQWLFGQVEELLKRTSDVIDTTRHQIKDEQRLVHSNLSVGYSIEVPLTTKDESSIIVRTIFSGPFKLPEGYTLVSAIYDVTIEKELKEPVTIYLQHCVRVNNQLLQKKMHFARATINFEAKMFDFEVVEDGTFLTGENRGSLKIMPKKDCLNYILCVLFEGTSQDTSMKYAAQYSYTRHYKNFWSLSIIFEKDLSAHQKFTQAGYYNQFAFVRTDGSDDLALKNISDAIEKNGWKISPSDENLLTITKGEIDEAHTKKLNKKLNKKFNFPSINLNVYVHNENDVVDELVHPLKFQGTNLEICVKRQKEKSKFMALDVSEYPLQIEQDTEFVNPRCGYQIHLPTCRDNGTCVTVRTIISGPFVLPSGYSLASAAYEITMPQLAQPVIIEVEHCVNVNDDDSVKQNMCFATATIDMQTQKFEFIPFEGASPSITNESATITVNDSCLVCILYQESKNIETTAKKYSAQWTYKKTGHNSWNLNIRFTKYLSAHDHRRHIKSEHQQSFVFKKPTNDYPLHLELDSILSADRTAEMAGWAITACDDTPTPVAITKEEIDGIELANKMANFPSINLQVCVKDKETAIDELDKTFMINGTDLEIVINRKKEVEVV